VPPLLPCDGDVEGVLPKPPDEVPSTLEEPPPPPEPPFNPFFKPEFCPYPPAPPPVDVIVENTLSLPFGLVSLLLPAPAPPAPTVIV
jgi:hypothetical protein